MKTILAICFTLAVFHASVDARPQLWPSNLIPLPQVTVPGFADFRNILSAVTQVHSSLSKTPLKPFLPSPSRMAMDIMNMAMQAKNAQDAINKAQEHMTTLINNAAASANLPNIDFSQFQSQMQDSLSQAMNQVGSAPPPPKPTQ